MTNAQLTSVVSLFKAVVGMEDDIKLQNKDVTDTKDATTAQGKFAKIAGKAAKVLNEKRALVQRTHKAALKVLLSYEAKPRSFAVSDVYDIYLNDKSSNLVIVTCSADPADPAISRPTGMEVLDLTAIQEASIVNMQDAVMAALSNYAAENVSQNARDIVQALGIEAEAKQLADAHKAAQADSGVVLWFSPLAYQGPDPTVRTAFTPAATSDPNAPRVVTPKGEDVTPPEFDLPPISDWDSTMVSPYYPNL